jgi:tyrosinase
VARFGREGSRKGRPIDAQLTINGGPNSAKAYIGWTPVPARLRILNGPAAGSVTVTLRNLNAALGGQVCFKLDRKPPFPTTLTLPVPGNGTPVDLFIAGQFGRPSRADRDAAIEAIDQATNHRLSVTRLMVRIRKNATSLTNAERYRFLEAFGTLNDRGMGTFADFPSMHRDAGLNQAHGNAGFLPWHRAMVLDLERELQAIDTTVALPYWRFDLPAPSVFTKSFLGTPDATGAVAFEPGHPLESWVTDSIPGILRTPGFNTQSGAAFVVGETATLNRAEPANTYSSWRGMEGNPHGSAHTSFTGFISDVQTAARDPLFFLLHCNVDRLWAKWQWIKKRLDVTKTTTFSPLGTGTTAIGHNLDDTLWPWNGDTSPGRPPTAPGGPFPASALTNAPGSIPTLKKMIDYRGVKNAASWLGFDYDDVPFDV